MILTDIDQLFHDPIQRHLPAALELNDELAKNPEISLQEFRSSAKIVDLLRSQRLEVEYPFAGEPTGFKASIPGARGNGPKIAILVEYDALPGVGHGCGHSASGSISILSGLAIKELSGQFSGQVDLIGTPDEEYMGGKIRMAKQGAFEGYDLAIMMHMFSASAVYAPFLALDGTRFEFTGQAAHAAATPWDGRNALNAVQLLFHASDMLRQHVKPDIRIHGIITKGGDAPNIVPDFAAAEFYTRGSNRQELDSVTAWLYDCARGAALATHTEVKFVTPFPSMKDLEKNHMGAEALTRLYQFYNLDLADEASLPQGSSDIGEVGDYCPTFHPMMKVKSDITLHTKEFAAEMLTECGHQAISNGARIVAGFVWMCLNDESLLKEIKQEFEDRRKR